MNRGDLFCYGSLGIPPLPESASQAMDSRKVSSDPIRPHSSHLRILEVKHQFEDYQYRTSYQFGGRTVDRVTLLNVTVRVVSASGKEASGFGSMPLANLWSFPSQVVSYNQSLEAMRRLAARIELLLCDNRKYSHPIDIQWETEPAYFQEASRVSSEMRLAEPIPALCTLVTASPFDAALHDAFGKANSINCYLGYGPTSMDYDLSHYLGPEFRGEYLDKYVSSAPRPFVFLYHSVGASDPHQ